MSLTYLMLDKINGSISSITKLSDKGKAITIYVILKLHRRSLRKLTTLWKLAQLAKISSTSLIIHLYDTSSLINYFLTKWDLKLIISRNTWGSRWFCILAALITFEIKKLVEIGIIFVFLIFVFRIFRDY